MPTERWRKGRSPSSRCRPMCTRAWRAAERHRAARLADHARARRIRRPKPKRMRARFDDAFFDEALGTYVLALDGDKRPCRVQASNAGHALFAGIAYPERRRSGGANADGQLVLLRLGHPHGRFHGSPLQSDELSQRIGLAARQCADRRRSSPRYGFRREAAQSLRGPVRAPRPTSTSGACPNSSADFLANETRGPTFYPVACTPQAWAAAAPLYLIQSCLGLAFRPRWPADHLSTSPSFPLFSIRLS